MLRCPRRRRAIGGTGVVITIATVSLQFDGCGSIIDTSTGVRIAKSGCKKEKILVRKKIQWIYEKTSMIFLAMRPKWVMKWTLFASEMGTLLCGNMSLKWPKMVQNISCEKKRINDRLWNILLEMMNELASKNRLIVNDDGKGANLTKSCRDTQKKVKNDPPQREEWCATKLVLFSINEPAFIWMVPVSHG